MAIFALAAFGFTSVAEARTIVVDDDGVQCDADFDSIQAGVDAADPGDTVLVCRGVYREQVTITTNNLTVKSRDFRRATIKAPSSELDSPEALVRINGAGGVKLLNFQIFGPGPGTNDSLRFGVLIEGNEHQAPDRVQGNAIKDIRDQQACACENGDGVRVGRDSAGTAGKADVVDNNITDYQKSGVTVDGASSFANVNENTITGLGLITDGQTPPPAQQGLQVGRGAAAHAVGNKISNNHFSGTTGEESLGILVFNTDASDNVFQKNRVSNNDDGIVLQDVNRAKFKENRVFGNHGHSGEGILVLETSSGAGGGNTFDRNDARSNDGLDCDDQTTGTGTAGTGNTWTHDRGLDSNPPEICKP